MATTQELYSFDPSYGASTMAPLSWIVALGLLTTLLIGGAMGANDVANSFGTSVGAGVVTIRQAVIIAAIFDTTGAMALGRGVTKTIASKIIDINLYNDVPATYMLGLMCAGFATVICVAIATRFALPISTSHAVVSAIAGFSLVHTSKGIVMWPGLGSIFVSWVTSPFIAGLVSGALFYLTRRFVIEQPTDVAIERQRTWISAVTGMVIFLFVVFVVYATVDRYAAPWSWLGVVVALLIGLAVFTVMQALVTPRLFAFYDQKYEVTPPTPDIAHRAAGEATKLIGGPPSAIAGVYVSSTTVVLERRFQAVQLVTACFMALAHGSNDAANAAGCFAGIWAAFRQGQVTKQMDDTTWIVALSCVGSIIGLVLYGSIVIQTIGSGLTHMSPSRGYSVELGTAITVLAASFMNLPVSSTHCVVGAVIFVGMVDARGLQGVHWGMVGRILVSWGLTLPLAGGVSAILFASLRGLITGSAFPIGASLVYCVPNGLSYNCSFPAVNFTV